MITSYGRYLFFGITWNYHAIIFLSENSVKFDLILDSLFDKNAPFGIERKVSGRPQIFPKQENSALTQLYHAPVYNNTVREFFSTFFSGEYF